jgi:transposase
MSSEKYIGLDVHQATISVAVMDSQGKVMMESILETKASTILEFFAGLHGSLFVTFEEGTWAAWLYDLLKPHVTEVLVCNPRKIPLLKHGNKSDKIDARKLAERLRLHDLKPVYHGETGVRMLRELARSYLTVVKDPSRVMNRLKAFIVAGRSLVPAATFTTLAIAAQWLEKIPEAGTRRRAEQLYCANKRAANCWRRVANIPSLPSCGRFRRWDRFVPARLWFLGKTLVPHSIKFIEYWTMDRVFARNTCLAHSF